MNAHHRLMMSLRGLGRGHGRSDAVRVWIVLWSHTRHYRNNGDVWPCNKTIAEQAGLTIDLVRRALRMLEDAGKITRRWSRPRGMTKCVRIITLAPDIARTSNPRVLRLQGGQIQALKRMLTKETDGFKNRPGPLIGLAMVLFAMARMNGGDTCFVSMAALREITDASDGGAFYARLEELETQGVISKVGESWADGIRVADLEAADVIELERAIAALPPPRVRTLDPQAMTLESQARLAAMSEAFARCHYA